MEQTLGPSPAFPGNGSNASEPCLSAPQHASITALLCLVFFVGFALNGFSLWVFCCRMPSWTSGTVLQFNLALSDAIATPVIPMLVAYFAADNDWRLGHFLCQVKIALLSAHFTGSSVFLMLISVQRYRAVVHFNHDSRMKRKEFVKKLCGAVWTLLLLQAIALACTLPTSREGRQRQCLSIHQSRLTDSYFVVNFVLFAAGFLLPFLVSAACYGRLAGTLTRLNVSSAKGLRVKLKSRRMIGVCLLIFGLCFLPLNMVRTAAVVLKKFYPARCRALQGVETAYYALWVLAGVNSCLDPLLYFFGSHSFRDAFGSFRLRRADGPSRSDSEGTANL